MEKEEEVEEASKVRVAHNLKVKQPEWSCDTSKNAILSQQAAKNTKTFETCLELTLV